jgi:hypothetical protein
MCMASDISYHCAVYYIRYNAFVNLLQVICQLFRQ